MTELWRGRDPRIAWVLAVAGALALSGSLVGGWQVTRLPPELTDGQPDEVVTELTGIGGWGAAWLIALTALATCAALALSGLPTLRPAARSVGLALAGAQLALLVLLSIQLERVSVLETNFLIAQDFALESELGPAPYRGYLGLALLAAGLWWSRPELRPAGSGVVGSGTAGTDPYPPPPGHRPTAGATGAGGPADLTVAPAEPFTQLGDDHTWR